MKPLRVGALVVLLALGVVACDHDEEVTYSSENCASAVDRTGQLVTLCCRVRCTAEYDYDDYAESCTEATTCTTATGAACPVSGVEAVFAPPCLY